MEIGINFHFQIQPILYQTYPWGLHSLLPSFGIHSLGISPQVYVLNFCSKSLRHLEIIIILFIMHNDMLVNVV